MDSRRQLVLSAVVLLTVILAVYGLYIFSADKPDNSLETVNNPSQYIEDFRLIDNPNPDETWILTSPEARRNKGEIELTAPRLVYKVDSDTGARASARRGLYLEADDILRLEEDVDVVRDTPSQHLETEKLIWQRSDGIMKTDSAVKFTDERGVFEAVGMRWDISAERMEFQSNIKLRWH
ncbi:MAG: LPS export ABC transporter periplasmic protein LptC [bacterium]